MPSTNPKDYTVRRIRWFYDRLRERYYSPRKKPLLVPSEGIFDAPYACVKINYQWVSHIVGLLSVLTEPDAWLGDEEMQYHANQEIERLIAVLRAGRPEEEIVTSFRFTVDCGMEYSNDNGETWLPVPGWAAFAEDCFAGAPGAPGTPGAPGAPGAPGEDCECSPVPSQPPIPADPIDRDGQACAIARGVGNWLHQIFDDALDVIISGINAAKIIEGIVSDLIDAIPVIGAIVDALMDFATNVIAQSAQEVKDANGFYFLEMIQCELYRIMKCDTEDFTVEYLSQVKSELRAWALALPPQTPLLVLIGQAFAFFLDTVPDEELLRRANAYKTASPDCDLCETDDCPSEACDAVHVVWVDIGATPDAWVGLNETLSVAGWEGDTTDLAGEYVTARGANEAWGRTGVANQTHWTGVKYVLGEPCSVSNLEMSYQSNSGNSKRLAIAVLRASDGVYEVLSNSLRPAIAPLSGALVWNGDAIDVLEVVYIFATGITPSGTINMRITSNRVNDPS